MHLAGQVQPSKRCEYINGERLILKRKIQEFEGGIVVISKKRFRTVHSKKKAREEHLIFSKTEIPQEKTCMSLFTDLAKNNQSIVTA